MKVIDELPASVVELLRGALSSEFATVSAQGVPIDTPMFLFPADDFSAFNVGTGLSYPAKAERARRNPKTGLLVAGGRNDPVVAICGHAAVHDADIQRTTDFYLAETAVMRTGREPWPHARHAVWYWTRMIVAIAPVRIHWWDNPDAMEGAPKSWNAPADRVYPASDPAPTAPASTPPGPSTRPWRDLAEAPLAAKFPGHLTLCDSEGYPIPMRARDIQLTDDGFVMTVPAGAPWARAGKATLSFIGRETFVGEVVAEGAQTRLVVERALPINPFMGDPKEVWDPSPETRARMMGRLEQELARRGQSIPNIPDEEPLPTSQCGRIRQAKLGY